MDVAPLITEINGIVTTLTTDVAPAMAGVAAAGLGVSLIVRWVRNVRSAI